MKKTGTKRIIRYYDELGECNVITLESYTINYGWEEIERHEKGTDGNFYQKDCKTDSRRFKNWPTKMGEA